VKNFKVNIQQGIFLYKFVNENNLNYIESVPPFNYFDSISKEEYNYYNNV